MQPLDNLFQGLSVLMVKYIYMYFLICCNPPVFQLMSIAFFHPTMHHYKSLNQSLLTKPFVGTIRWLLGPPKTVSSPAWGSPVPSTSHHRARVPALPAILVSLHSSCSSLLEAFLYWGLKLYKEVSGWSLCKKRLFINLLCGGLGRFSDVLYLATGIKLF